MEELKLLYSGSGGGGDDRAGNSEYSGQRVEDEEKITFPLSEEAGERENEGRAYTGSFPCCEFNFSAG